MLRNVRVADRDGLAGATEVWAAVKDAEEELGDQGRVLVRASGTEPLVRVMVEAATVENAEQVAGSLAELVGQPPSADPEEARSHAGFHSRQTHGGSPPPA